MFIFITCLLLIVIVMIYMVYLAFSDEITYEQLSFKNISPEVSPFTIFFIADIHRRKINEQTLKKVHRKIDLVIIGGDLIERGVPLDRMRNNIKKLRRWSVPIYFVWGNNDYEVNEKEIADILRNENVTILKDDVTYLEIGDNKINLIGIDYSKTIEVQPEIQWDKVDDSFTIFITHHPYSFEYLHTPNKKKIDFVLAGHTHGGQIRIFGFGLYTKGGLFTRQHTKMFITEGYGYSLLPLRLQTRAQCHVITLQQHKE